MMPAAAHRHACVIGTQWGDEGKGKIVDVLSEFFDAVVRFQGGANAGHTILFEGTQYIMHLLPSGILRPGKLAILGGGMVIDPATLLGEIEAIQGAGIDTAGRIFVSDRAHVVLPLHRILDRAAEQRAGAGKIGTTLRGIGPCYEDKIARRGVRMAELVDPALLRSRLERLLPEKNEIIERVYGEKPLELEPLWQELSSHGEKLRPLVANVTELLNGLASDGKTRILFEGAQGAMLDVDLGTYPYVTSSNTCVGAVGPGCGFSPRKIDEVIGVAKAYATRVGEGPFPSEAEPAIADKLRKEGGEYGATTGRPRRCGWLDMVALRYAMVTSDVDTLVITKLDVLDSLPEIRVAVAYRKGRQTMKTFPATASGRAFEVEWKTFPGWQSPTAQCRTFDELPAACRAYLAWICRETDRPLRMISVGRAREHIIRCDPPYRPRMEAT
jgi:adenylosuccinate synthase